MAQTLATGAEGAFAGRTHGQTVSKTASPAYQAYQILHIAFTIAPIIAGVGAVIVFLPQILLLFLFIGFLGVSMYAITAFLETRLTAWNTHPADQTTFAVGG